MAEAAWTAGWAAEATGAELSGAEATPFMSIVTDSREVRPGALFVALRGERLDGHQFVPAAFEAGAAGALCDRPVEAPSGRAVLRVADTVRAYGDLGREWRRRFDPLTVAVTGSCGKSSTKELIGEVLAVKLRTLRSRGNYNNEIGLPATLLELRAEHEALVVELAMRGAGQIDYLASLALPQVGVITNIGSSHAELLGSRAAVAAAKGELLERLGPDGVAVLNADDLHLPAQAARHRGRTLWYGFGPAADIRAVDVVSKGLRGSTFRLILPRAQVQVELPLPGRHMLANALAAAAVGLTAGLSAAEIARGLAQAANLPLRLEVVTLANGARLINDAYNAAPDSVRAALEVLAGEPAARRVAVLGDMLELGESTQVEHLAVGAEAGRVVDVLVAVGELGAQFAVAARDAGCAEVHEVADAEAAGALLSSLLRAGDLALLKASRRIGLERALEPLEKQPWTSDGSA
ncbi:MAG: UDP-N-acetylmuramoyl-tripeptide--D-alanyl-D-alanine ligase [Armatimonadetes bacterium]|nr:UDP-N-acetylmuramoyl-tripeptide--D-alanyl-D-alanine ligase [Armatimonadota bacterium]